MSKILQDSTFFCLAISLIGYEIGIILRQKTKLALCNPLLISIVFVIIILKVTNIKYEVYEDGSQLLSYLLTPSTVCLAIPLYQQMGLLKKNMKAILAGILSGVFTSLAGVWVFSTITVAAIIITGIIGNMFGDVICRLCGIRHPIATGLAIGTATHAMGTAKAMEIGEIEGAMSSLSIAVAGLITVVGSTIFYQLY